MNSLDHLRQQITWVQNWLGNDDRHEGPIFDDFEIINHAQCDGSNDGVKSLGDGSVFDFYSEDGYAIENTVPSNHTGALECARADSLLSACECNSHEFDTSPGRLRDNDHEERARRSPLPRSEFYLAIDYEDDDYVRGKDGRNYELSGRAPENTFRDMRSPARARNRRRAEGEKYFFYKSVNRGAVGQQQFDTPAGLCSMAPPDLLQHQPLVTVTKKMLYEAAQLYPRPPTYSLRKIAKDYCPWNIKYEHRMRARKHAHADLAQKVEEIQHRDLHPTCLCMSCTFHSLDDPGAFLSEWCAAQAPDSWCEICNVAGDRCRHDKRFGIDQAHLTFESDGNGQGSELSWKEAEEPLQPETESCSRCASSYQAESDPADFVGLYADEDELVSAKDTKCCR